jgi:hypothetical protein
MSSDKVNVCVYLHCASQMEEERKRMEGEINERDDELKLVTSIWG